MKNHTNTKASLGALVLLAACNGRSAEAPTPAANAAAPAAAATTNAALRCDFEPGDRLAYTLTTHASLDGDIAAMGPNLPSDTSGFDEIETHDLELRALDKTSRGATLVQVSSREPGGPWSRLLVKVAANCDFVDIGASPSMPEAERNQLISRLTAFEFVGADDASSTWTTEQALPYGRARLAYRATALPDGRTVIDRRVARMLEGDPTDGVREAGRLRAWVKADHAWVDRLELDRQVTVPHNGALTTAREGVVLTYQAPAKNAPPALAPDAVRWTGVTTKPLGGHNRTYPAANAPKGLAQLDKTQVLASLLRGLATDDAKELLTTRRMLVHTLRARNDVAVELANQALDANLSDKGLGTLIIGLTDAGTDDAEEALIAVLEDERSKDELRSYTAFVMHRQVKPTAATVEALKRATQSKTFHERTRHTSWAALGALIGYDRLPLDVEADVRDHLAAAVNAETDKGLLLTLISSVGNSRHAGLIDEVERRTAGDQDATVRVHAMVVLERMGAAPSPSRVLAMMDELHDVRHLSRLARLARTGDLVVTDDDLQQAVARLAPASRKLVRQAATHLIGRRAQGNPALRAELARWYTIENDAQIKRDIGRYVSARELYAAKAQARDSGDEPVSKLGMSAGEDGRP